MDRRQAAFESLLSDKVTPHSAEHLKTLALGLWFEEFTPEVKTLQGAKAAQAGYLLDKLTRYHCLDKSRKSLLRETLLPALEQQKGEPLASPARDMLVRRWGVMNDLKCEFRSLLPYQTRHYQHLY